MKKIVTIIGARPQIIKAAAISRAIKNHFSTEINEVIVHTGQHYDENMSAVFFNEMGIPMSKYNLQVGSGNHGDQTGKMIAGIEAILLEEKPDAVLVYGDTNSTLAGALAAAKIHIPVIHIEAGLRSYNKSMPEEINRIACDHMSTLLFCPTDQGMQNLTNEGFKSNSSDKASIDHPNVFKTGDIMFDNSLYFASISGNSPSLLESIGMLEKPYVLCTIHRDANTDQPIHLSSIFESLISISETSGWDIVLPLHPRTKNKMKENLDKTLSTKIFSNAKFHLIPPAGFLDMIALESNCQMVITDSGGVQKEAFFFKKPCIILRPQTEWVEIVENGNAILTGANGEKIQQAFHVLSQKTDYSYPAFFGDGKAAEEICSLILQSL